MRVNKNSWPITRNQLKAGRLLAGLGIRDLAELASISSTAINLIETGRTESPRVQTLIALKTALQQVGIEFLGGGWVRHCQDLRNGNTSSNGNAPSNGESRDRAQLERTLLLALRLLRQEPEGDRPAEIPIAERRERIAIPSS